MCCNFFGYRGVFVVDLCDRSGYNFNHGQSPERRHAAMKTLTLGTAQITQNDAEGTITVRFMGFGNFTVGTQMFGNSRQGANAALRFIRERGFRVI